MTRFTRRLALAAALCLAVAPAAVADAIPAPMELNEYQAALIGYWKEEGMANSPYGYGHGSQQRVLAIANETMVITTLAGTVPSNEYHATTLSGSWRGTRVDDKTVKITLDQGGGRGTELTLVFEGEDAFTLADAERQHLPPARFVRMGEKIKTY